MAIYRNVHISFWQDEDMIELTPEQKYFYLYLMTNSKTNQAGCYKISHKVMQFETGYNNDTVSKLLKHFVGIGKIGYCEGTQEVIIYNWLKYNWSSSPKVISCIENNIQDIDNAEFAEWLIDSIVRQYGYSIDTVSIPYRNKNKNKQKNKQENNNEINSDINEVNADIIPTWCISLAEQIYLNASKTPKKHELEAGAKVLHDIERLDGYKPDEIQKAIEWGLRDKRNGFNWSSQLKSPARLRNKRNGAGDLTKFENLRADYLTKNPPEAVPSYLRSSNEKRMSKPMWEE